MYIKKSELSLTTEKKPFPISPGLVLILFYLFGIGVRFGLALLFRHTPTVQIDESLYINIAKSLAAVEGITYRSQPVPYLYIFYPLLLTPLYFFPLPFDLYRVLQLWNALVEIEVTAGKMTFVRSGQFVNAYEPTVVTYGKFTVCIPAIPRSAKFFSVFTASS